MEQPVTKFRPEEFVVIESLIPPCLTAAPDAPYSYLCLRKSGYTTLQAVQIIGDHFGLAPNDVHFAGLKDEDAITEQTISIRGRLAAAKIGRFNMMYAKGATFLALTPLARGLERIRIGRLNGNGFRLRIRRLGLGFAAALGQHHRLTFHFLNYYDEQRFGVAGGPKTTHRIGEAVLAEDWPAALALVREAGTAESARAAEFVGDPKDFFASLDSRITDFYKSSCVSAGWNAALAAVVNDRCAPEDRCAHEIAGSTLVFCRSQASVLEVLGKQPALPYEKHYEHGGMGLRSTVVQTQILIDDVMPDDANPGYVMCDVAFFLPSGAYATMCVKQLASVREAASAVPVLARASA
jgi:tRNA pseudouridine13 synthase